LSIPGLFARVQLLGSSEYTAVMIDDREGKRYKRKNISLLLGADNKIEFGR